LVEPTLRFVGERLPRLSTIKYKPEYSVAWDGKSLTYYVHRNRPFHLRFWTQTLPLVIEWTGFWAWFWLRYGIRLYRLPVAVMKKLRRRLVKSE
jgi:hypothetical protein